MFDIVGIIVFIECQLVFVLRFRQIHFVQNPTKGVVLHAFVGEIREPTRCLSETVCVEDPK